MQGSVHSMLFNVHIVYIFKMDWIFLIKFLLSDQSRRVFTPQCLKFETPEYAQLEITH